MQFFLNANEDHFIYSASYIGDPLNDLLHATALALDKSKHDSYCCVFHDLEGQDITWLLKLLGDELSVIIWDGNVSDRDTLLTLSDNNFNSEAFGVLVLDKLPDFHQDLKFALKCKPEIFVRALINAVEGLYRLKKYDDRDWGFRYSQEDYDKLIEWSATREKELL
jgi:hypothetical protein